VRQQENRAADAGVASAPVRLDATRLEQFLDLQSALLLPTGDPDTLPDRLVQAVATFLGVTGAAVGVAQDGVYRVLAAYGVGPEYVRRYDGSSLGESELAPALAGARPLVLNELDGDMPLRTLIVPFRAGESRGALHVILEIDAFPIDDQLDLVRVLSGLAGIALANARQCRRLAQVARVRGDALAAMAHDLRAPLNALVGYTSLLDEGAFGVLTDEQQEISSTLERQAIELVDLLGATLDVARLETGHLPLRTEEFVLGDVLTALRGSTFARATREGRLTCTLSPDVPPLRTDRVKVKEIVQNLVDNALKHSDGRPVDVDVDLGPARETVRITVRDMGSGIAADVLPHLFEPFRPGPGRGRGTGFGLYIVRCFTEALGGHVTARSRPGEGTTMTVELPLAAPRG
jgi:signal transduction histidine kinase